MEDVVNRKIDRAAVRRTVILAPVVATAAPRCGNDHAVAVIDYSAFRKMGEYPYKGPPNVVQTTIKWDK